MSVLSREATIAPPTFNRWLMPAGALAIHLCIGQVYALSVFKAPFMQRFGAGELAVGWVFSLAIVVLGLSAAVGGTWVEKAGPRKAMVVAGAFWVSGFCVATLGIATGQLWLLYLGYGVIGGIGLGLGYISPVSTLMKWFPDRPGLATGLAIMGFGGGALIASPVSASLLSTFGGGSDPASLVRGLAPTFLTLAVIYAVVIAMGAFVIRLPHPSWTPSHGATGGPRRTIPAAPAGVSAANALKTPQFWLLWAVLFCNVTAGIGILENASPMIRDYFPQIDVASAAGFVGLLSLANMAGRFVWSSVSDYIGRKNMYMVYLGIGLLMYGAIAAFGGGSLPLFLLATMVILSFYGGGFATAPAYLRDLFGVYQVGAIHGRLLTAWSAAGIAGPLIVNSVVEHRTAEGASGPEVYTASLLIMVGVLAVGFVANLLIKAVDQRFAVPAGELPLPVRDGSGTTTAGAGLDTATARLHTVVAWVLSGVVILALGYGLTQVTIKALALFS
ncbi:OFA family MFS transporter [Arthrobacter sp. NPDC090010]|uniref:OFA family MFS transporter n=1 Tax=Arthrobacter sp. NPDC090010 TaxID=3363942 RepID=UPI003811ADCC